jgi:hypothetical protein
VLRTVKKSKEGKGSTQVVGRRRAYRDGRVVEDVEERNEQPGKLIVTTRGNHG